MRKLLSVFCALAAILGSSSLMAQDCDPVISLECPPDVSTVCGEEDPSFTGVPTVSVECFDDEPEVGFEDVILGDDGCTLAIHAIAEAQKQGGICAFIDAEHAFDRFYAESLGVDTENLLISQPDHGEQALEIADNLIRSGAIDLIVVDSVAALTPRAEIEGEMGDSQVGLQARLMSKALRKLTGTISKTGCCCMFINQLREKIGVMFGNPETTTGGNALKFYSSVRIDIRRSSQIKDGEKVVGNRTKIKIVKNKTAPPFQRAEFDIMYGAGISKTGEIIDLGVDLGIVKKSGSWFSYNDTKLGQGRDAVKQLIGDNPELMDELEDKIKDELTK